MLATHWKSNSGRNDKEEWRYQPDNSSYCERLLLLLWAGDENYNKCSKTLNNDVGRALGIELGEE